MSLKPFAEMAWWEEGAAGRRGLSLMHGPPERGALGVMEQIEEEMIREEEITWQEAESAKQQQEAELDLQAAEDEDEARLAAHLDHEVELDTSEWDQANPREYGTPSPVRRWRDELMAKKDRDEEEAVSYTHLTLPTKA